MNLTSTWLIEVHAFVSDFRYLNSIQIKATEEEHFNIQNWIGIVLNFYFFFFSLFLLLRTIRRRKILWKMSQYIQYRYRINDNTFFILYWTFAFSCDDFFHVWRSLTSSMRSSLLAFLCTWKAFSSKYLSS